MHGPASVGATMSATEVTRQFGIVSAICSAIPGSKIVTSSGTSASRWRTSSAIRSGNASLARRDADDVGLRGHALAHRRVVGVLEPGHLRPGGVERLADLLGEIATAHQQHAPRVRHARHPTQSAQQDFEPYAVQAISMSL